LRTLIFGYGNPDRQDDGVAWHVLHALMLRYGISLPDELDIDYQDEQSGIDYYFQLQLLPELAEELGKYDRVCFIDAHTGAVPEEIHVEKILPVFQNSPLTHHLTASSLLSIVQTMTNSTPETILISIRGYKFGFSQSLSEKTLNLVPKAVELIQTWLSSTARK
jgi:hydrogenase maturation protease